MAEVERFFFDEGGVPRGQIAMVHVEEVFDGAEFGLTPNIFNRDAAQTGLRFTDLEPDKRVLEFDEWADERGETRIRRLRIEVGEQTGKVAVQQYDYEVNKQGDYYLVGPGRLSEPEPEPDDKDKAHEAFFKRMTEGPEPYTPY